MASIGIVSSRPGACIDRGSNVVKQTTQQTAKQVVSKWSGKWSTGGSDRATRRIDAINSNLRVKICAESAGAIRIAKLGREDLGGFWFSGMRFGIGWHRWLTSW